MTAPAQTLQHRCRQLLDRLDLPDPFDLSVLVARLTARRQRPLRLLPLLPGLRDEPSGLWVPLPDEDVIFAESSVSGWYREHVIFHELGHMLWEHVGSVRDVSQWLGQYGVTGASGTRVAMRCSISEHEQEREAEMVALLIESRITRRSVGGVTSTTTPGEVAAVLNRLALALGSTCVSPDG